MSGSISSEDRGFTLGDGVFDTALVLEGRMLARERHVARLLAAADAIGIEVAPEAVESAIDAALTAEPAILRTTVTRGTAARGLWPASMGTPTVVTATAPWSPAVISQPARLITASGRRNEFSPSANLKTLGYLDHILAAREAARAGVDDALILNTRGNVACATIGNVMAVIGDALVTPALPEGCLPGIVRGLLIEAAPSLGLAVEERALEPRELAGARAVFLTNSVRLIRPVVALDGAELARAPAIEAALLAALRAALGMAA